ncbi:hypothetical protein WA026_020250 [Henosepilachna vigintioctopunctata]|uniref:Uncharacterized protein n=1 Tax=Henosepilachna vigintioctopunctata TaxID=420089 RepID=A0AAW1TXS3_9CUCU
MDEYVNKYKELKNRYAISRKELDIFQVEKKYLQYKSELSLRTNEIEKTVTETNNANVTLFELTKKLTDAKTKNNYLQNTMDSLKSRVETVRNGNLKNIQKLFESDQRSINIASENSILRDTLYRIQTENIDLKRTKAELEEKLQKLNDNLKEVTEKIISEDESLKKLEEQSSKLLTEYEKCGDLSKWMNEVDNHIFRNEKLKILYEKKNAEKFVLEKDLWFWRSEYGTLMQLVGDSPEISVKRNFMSTLSSFNLKKKIQHFSQEIEGNNRCLKELMEKWKQADLANKAMINDIEHYDEENIILRKKLEKVVNFGCIGY